LLVREAGRIVARRRPVEASFWQTSNRECHGPTSTSAVSREYSGETVQLAHADCALIGLGGGTRQQLTGFVQEPWARAAPRASAGSIAAENLSCRVDRSDATSQRWMASAVRRGLGTAERLRLHW